MEANVYDLYIRKLMHDLSSPLSVLELALGKLSREEASEDAMRLACAANQQVQLTLQSFASEWLRSYQWISGRDVEKMVGDIVLTLGIKDVFEISVDADAAMFRFRHNRGDLYRILFNVIKNAKEATAIVPGRKIAFASNVTIDGIRFAVRDNGRGIPPEHMPYIFEPNFSYGKENGKGLGLAIVKTLVGRNSGRVEVRSEIGKGTEVIVSYGGQ
jgi:signal transduction histidine kinase